MISLKNITTLCIPIVAAILGIAFPIVIQTISRIDTKYNSIRLIHRFKDERLYKKLWFSLIVATIALFYNNLIIFPWKKDWGVLNWYMSNSSNIIVLISTLYVIVVLFKVVKLTTKYFDYIKLFENILATLEKSKKEAKRINEDDIRVLAELARYTITRDDNKTLLGLFYQLLNDYSRELSEKKSSTPIEYDNWYYDTILLLNETICKKNIRPISLVNASDIILLLIPESSKSIISDKTYSVLWKALQQQLFYNKTEWLYEYWSYAHQYRWLRLKAISIGYYNVYTKEEAETRKEQIRKFTEFHLALCGYILYLKEYALIKKIVTFTQSEPYQFVLVPSTFVEILEQFKLLSNVDSRKSLHFYKHYPFLGERGIKSGDISLGWTKKYLTLLLFRLNSFDVQYTASYIDPWELPITPQKLKEVDALQTIVKQMLHFAKEWDDNSSVLNELGWNVEDDDVDPFDKLNKFSELLREAKNEKRKNIAKSINKFKQFNKKTKEIIEKNACVYRDVLDRCDTQLNKGMLIKDVINTSFSQKMEKETFSDESISTHLNFDEIMAEIMVRDFLHIYSSSFYKHRKRHYTINSDEVFSAMERLIGEKRDDYIVLVFGLHLDFYLDGPQKQPALSKMEEGSSSVVKYNFKESLEIYSLPTVGNGIMDQVAVIIKRDDLPCYENYMPTTDIINKLKLDSDPIDEELKIYTSVLFDNFPQRFENLEDTVYCLATIYYCVLLYWKKDADVTILKTITRYLDSGKGMDISELPKLGQ